MSAIHELRRLLDERGEKHWDVSDLTFWLKDNNHHNARAMERVDGSISLAFDNLTPEQAIDATLGRRKCHDKGDEQDFICSECGMHLYKMYSSECYTMIEKDMLTTIESPRFCPGCGREVEK